jgi:hypothetical protein
MKELIKRLQIEVQSELELVNPYASPVKGYDQKMKVVKYAILELKHHLDVHSFPDKSTEVEFFKQWLPGFCKQYIYFTALFHLECTRITSDSEIFNTYLKNERCEIADFRIQHKDMYLYHLLGKTDKDEELFVRNPLPDTLDFIRQEENFCGNSVILSELLAYDDYEKVLEKELELINVMKTAVEGRKLKWKGTKSDTVELAVLFYEIRSFEYDDQPATIEQIKEWFEEKMDIDLKDFAIIDNNNRSRKKSVYPLLDKLNQAAKNRWDRLNP